MANWTSLLNVHCIAYVATVSTVAVYQHLTNLAIWHTAHT